MAFRRCATLFALLTALAAYALSVNAHEQMLREFIAAYDTGDLARLPLAEGATENVSDSALRDHQELFATTRQRQLTLKNVRWNDKRITADYHLTVDGRPMSGSVTFYAENHLITRIVHDPTIWPESETNLADTGQALDKGTTAIALAGGGFAEANPLFGGIGPGAALAIGTAVIAMRNVLVRDLPLSECIEQSRAFGAAGWGAGVNNLIMMAGGGPAALLVGIVGGVIAWNQNYKGACVDGPIRAVSLP